MAKPLRILFVWTAAEYATYDVARGYHAALDRMGHTLFDYRLSKRMVYHEKALGKPVSEDIEIVCRLASETVIVEALRSRVDLVFIASGLTFHPDGVWYLARCGIPTVTVFTESPYDDKKQVEFAEAYPGMKCGTQERTSARLYDWTYLRPAYDPDIHKPYDDCEEEPCDVLMIGTGWSERKKFLSQVDWSGIDLKLIGTWTIRATPGCLHREPVGEVLAPYVRDYCLDNRESVRLYQTAKICLNMHRFHPTAESLNPRSMELAACGVFQLSDHRPELEEIFSDSVPTYTDAESLGSQIRYYLNHPDEMKDCAATACQKVQGQTFDDRAWRLMSQL